MPTQQPPKQLQPATTALPDAAATNGDGDDRDLTDYHESGDEDFVPDDVDDDEGTDGDLESESSDDSEDGVEERIKRFDGEEYRKWKEEQERRADGGDGGEKDANEEVEEDGDDGEVDAVGGDEGSGWDAQGEDGEEEEEDVDTTTPEKNALLNPFRRVLPTAIILFLFSITGAPLSELAILIVIALAAFMIRRVLEPGATTEFLRQATLVGLGVRFGVVGCLVLLLVIGED